MGIHNTDKLDSPLVVWNPWYRSAVCYFGEHAKIMRMAFNIPADCGAVVKRIVE